MLFLPFFCTVASAFSYISVVSEVIIENTCLQTRISNAILKNCLSFPENGNFPHI